MSRPLGSRLTSEHRAAISAGLRQLGRTVERTEALSAALIEMRSGGMSQERCAKRLGIAVSVCARWCAELGMSRLGPWRARKTAEAASPGRSALSPSSDCDSSALRNADQKA